MCNQGNQSVLLAVGQLTEALQQLTFVKRKLRAVQTQTWFITQCAFLNQTLLNTRNNFRVHAAVVLFGNVRNTLAHAFR